MHRCLQLAKLGLGTAAPNPMVGAVLVHENKIIGEGYHEYFGGPHAEVNCIMDAERRLNASGGLTPIAGQCTLYVSLEPCNHFGKTPPCTEFIINKQIKQVVVGCADHFHKVNGRGIERLKKEGIQVITGVLNNLCNNINKRFFTFQLKKRPYIILKWAQTNNGFIASNNTERLFITNEITNHLVHKWRSEEQGIMIGKNTALIDNPQLTNRLWTGKNPIRIIIDLEKSLPPSLHFFDTNAPTIVFNYYQQSINPFNAKLSLNEPYFFQLNKKESAVTQICNKLYELQIQSIIIEGGAKWLQSFIDADCWDEARVIQNINLSINKGLAAPELKNQIFNNRQMIYSDMITYYFNISNLDKNCQALC